MIRLSHLDEPRLEFGAGMRHIDSRFGLMDNGPFDAATDGAPSSIRIGIVGSVDTVEGTVKWIERCAAGIDAKQSRQPTLFPAFPGLGLQSPFRCTFTIPNELQRILPKKELKRLSEIPGQADATKAIVTALVSEVASLTEMHGKPDVVLIALPLEFIMRTVNAKAVETDGGDKPVNDDEDHSDGEKDTLDFRGLLKASAMGLRVPIQLLWPTTYDSTVKIPRKIKEASDRRVQDDATRAWNMFTALYYKAGGLPWRLARDSRQLRTSFVGISFYKSVDGQKIHTSTAQMFDERGEGLILRGGRAIESSDDRRPHLTEEEAFNLLSNSLNVFRQQHGHFPARVVLHKTSKFDDAELSGLNKALDLANVDYADFVGISKSTTRVYRHGPYPALRGTLLRFDNDNALLFTRGSVEFFKTYPGMYVPRPLLLKCQVLNQPLQLVGRVGSRYTAGRPGVA